MKTRVLVVDDEEEVRKSIKNSLTIFSREQESIDLSNKIEALFGNNSPQDSFPFMLGEEFEVVAVDSGESGLELIKDSIAKNKPFQVIFIDVRMPGMGGDECGRLIRALDPHAGICLITGYSDKSVTSLVKNIGGAVDNVLFLKKPFSDDEARQISRAFSARWYAELKSRGFQRGLQNLIDDILSLKDIPLNDLHKLLKTILEHMLVFIGVKNGFIASIDDSNKLQFEVGSGIFESQQDIDHINLPGDFYRDTSNKSEHSFIMNRFHDNVVISITDVECRRVIVVVDNGTIENENKYFIKIFSENAMVSLQNAGLFKKLEDAKISLEEKIKERTLELEDANRTLQEIAIKDHLTGVYNRRYFEEMLEIEVNRCKKENKDLALMMIDVDFFKSINDKYGHKEGDNVLASLAAILTNSLSKTDIISRYGGDEFLVMLDNVDMKEAYAIANRIIKAFFQLPFKDKYPDIDLELSIGIAFLISDMYYIKSGADLFQKVDEALYLAKRNGKNRIETWKLSDELYTPQHEIQWENITTLINKMADVSLRTREEHIEEIASIISVLESKDPFTANHSKNVATYTKEFLLYLTLEQKYADEIYRAAILHDIGKIGVPGKILSKNGSLTPDELKVIRNHPLLSVKILKQCLFKGKEILIVKHHHERFDGTGYPDGLKQNYIPYGSRIIAIIDTFDALTNNRAYRSKMDIDTAMNEMKKCAGTQLDPELLDKFLSLVNKNRDRWPLNDKQQNLGQ